MFKVSIPKTYGRTTKIYKHKVMWTSWSRHSYAKTQIPEKPSKSGLIGVWHKDNFYLGTSTIRNRKSPPNEY
jgi:hypothetical protein